MDAGPARRSPNWAEDLVRALVDTYATTDYRAWFPFSPDRLVPYYYEEFVRRLHQAIRTLGSKGRSQADTARLLPHVGHFRQELDQLLAYWGHGDLRVSPRILSEVCMFIIDAFSHLCPHDPFSRRGHLWILNDEQVKELVDKTPWTKATPNQTRQAAKLVVSANMLAYALYTDIWVYAVGDICHGPYPMRAGEQLIVRDYLDLVPRVLWRKTKTWQLRCLRILTVYGSDVDLRIDFYGNLNSSIPSQE